MLFPFLGFRSRKPIPSLGGGVIRYKPVIRPTVIGPRGQHRVEALIDSGSDDVVFSVDLAARIGVDLSQASSGQAQGLGGSNPVPLLYAPVILLLADATQSCRWRSVVAFTPARLHFAIFGIAGGLEFFRTTLDVVDREIILLPKSSLPLTTSATP